MKGAILDLSMLSAFKPFCERQKLLFALLVPLSLVPIWCFDRVDVPFVVLFLIAVPLLARLLTPRYWRHVLLVPALALLALGGAEACIRVSYFGLSGLNVFKYAPAEPASPLSGVGSEPGTGTGFKPGREYFLFGHPFRVNSDGFRGKDRPVAKEPGVYRIVMIGASFTQGMGVAEEDRVSDVLEAILNERKPLARRFEVFNLTLIGNTLGNLAYYLRETGLKYSPDLILVEIGAQTLSVFSSPVIEPNQGHFKKAEGASRFFPNQPYLDAHQRFFFQRFFLGRVIHQYQRPKLGGQLAEDERIEKGFRQLREIAGRTPLVFYHLRAPSNDMADTNHQIGFRRITRRLTRGLGIPVIDTAYAEYPKLPMRKLTIYPGDLHPNKIVHRVYAETLFERLLPLIRGAGGRNERPEGFR